MSDLRDGLMFDLCGHVKSPLEADVAKGVIGLVVFALRETGAPAYLRVADDLEGIEPATA